MSGLMPARQWLLCLLIVCISLAACQPKPDVNGEESVTLAEAMGDDITGNFARAFKPRDFAFPRDHAAHPEFRHEWWYFTGNVQATTGERFGYELTIFRVALKPPAQEFISPNIVISEESSPSDDISSWRTNHIYMAHLAITDIDNNEFHYTERFSRDALGLAGAGVFFRERIDHDSTRLRVWLDDWSIESVGDTVFPIQISAKHDDFGISLVLKKSKPVVLQGDKGFSVKGDKPGNASYYYSITRMITVGSVTVGGKKYSITGNSWLDREWSTSRLEDDQQGWDWFALQLDDQREIMFYALRREDGSMDIHSAGTIVDKDGTTHKLEQNDVNIQVLRHWQSPHSDINYPAGWIIEIPSQSLELQVTPAINDQELNLTVRYWEGAVKVSGKYSDSNKIVAGKGYVELAGYEPG
ncbi:MAG: lipocalin-like domain-containing protein [Gammaproteobacteria bacterium]|jgi:predicted secreted hydrolase